MSRPYSAPLQLVQIVRVTIVLHPSGILVARSPDVPGRAAFASDMASLDVEIRDLIEGYFAKEGERVRVRRARGKKRDDLSTWEVESIDHNDEQLLAAE
jgi:hypothetical protein